MLLRVWQGSWACIRHTFHTRNQFILCVQGNLSKTIKTSKHLSAHVLHFLLFSNTLGLWAFSFQFPRKERPINQRPIRLFKAQRWRLGRNSCRRRRRQRPAQSESLVSLTSPLNAFTTLPRLYCLHLLHAACCINPLLRRILTKLIWTANFTINSTQSWLPMACTNESSFVYRTRLPSLPLTALRQRAPLLLKRHWIHTGTSLLI